MCVKYIGQDTARLTRYAVLFRQVLREAKAALEGQLQAARLELQSLGAKFDKAREELFVIQSAKDSDIAALRYP